MQFHFELIIQRPRQEVWDCFDNTGNLLKWQPTLVSFDHQYGAPGQVGAVSRLTYVENAREIILAETITARNEPKCLEGRYENEMCTNTVHNTFEEVSPTKTMWVMKCELKFRGVYKLMEPFMKGMIANRLRDDMQRFKELAEAGEATKN